VVLDGSENNKGEKTWQLQQQHPGWEQNLLAT
jgi:hypothetical protein